MAKKVWPLKSSVILLMKFPTCLQTAPKRRYRRNFPVRFCLFWCGVVIIFTYWCYLSYAELVARLELEKTQLAKIKSRGAQLSEMHHQMELQKPAFKAEHAAVSAQIAGAATMMYLGSLLFGRLIQDTLSLFGAEFEAHLRRLSETEAKTRLQLQQAEKELETASHAIKHHTNSINSLVADLEGALQRGILLVLVHCYLDSIYISRLSRCSCALHRNGCGNQRHAGSDERASPQEGGTRQGPRVCCWLA